MLPYIKITKRNLKQPFKVQHIGKNGEQLGNPETFLRKEKAFKNIRAYLELFNGERVLVDDSTKEGKSGEWESNKFWYYKDKSTSVFNE